MRKRSLAELTEKRGGGKRLLLLLLFEEEIQSGKPLSMAQILALYKRERELLEDLRVLKSDEYGCLNLVSDSLPENDYKSYLITSKGREEVAKFIETIRSSPKLRKKLRRMGIKLDL